MRRDKSNTATIEHTKEYSISSSVHQYEQYARHLVFLFIGEPEWTAEDLINLREIVACARSEAKEANYAKELAEVQSALICLHHLLKAYENHGYPVSEILEQICHGLEKRRDNLDPSIPR